MSSWRRKSLVVMKSKRHSSPRITCLAITTRSLVVVKELQTKMMLALTSPLTNLILVAKTKSKCKTANSSYKTSKIVRDQCLRVNLLVKTAANKQGRPIQEIGNFHRCRQCDSRWPHKRHQVHKRIWTEEALLSSRIILSLNSRISSKCSIRSRCRGRPPCNLQPPIRNRNLA